MIILVRSGDVSAVNESALNRRANLEDIVFLIVLAEVKLLHDLGGGVVEDRHVDCSVRLLVGGG